MYCIINSGLFATDVGDDVDSCVVRLVRSLMGVRSGYYSEYTLYTPSSKLRIGTHNERGLFDISLLITPTALDHLFQHRYSIH
jgi:hypothetical protein